MDTIKIWQECQHTTINDLNHQFSYGFKLNNNEYSIYLPKPIERDKEIKIGDIYLGSSNRVFEYKSLENMEIVGEFLASIDPEKYGKKYIVLNKKKYIVEE